MRFNYDITTVRHLFRLARLHFLVPGMLLYTLGAFLAISNGAKSDPGLFFRGYAIFFFAHLSVHFSNDYFDREADKAAQRTSVSGGSGVLVDHPEMAPLALTIAICLLALSMVVAVAFTLIYSYSVWFLIFAGFGGLIGWFYTAPPLKLAYRGFGEASTAMATGFIMPGMGYFVMSGTIDLWFVVLSLPLICYGLLFIISVELPDVEADEQGGRVNLPVKFGLRNATRIAFVATGLGTSLLFAISYLGVMEDRLGAWYLTVFSIIPLALAGYGAVRDIRRRDQVLSQVKLNMAGLMSILTLFIVFSAMAIWAK